MSDRQTFVNAALAAGCPEDQVRNLIRARVWLQERQLVASAAARQCDRADGPTAVGYPQERAAQPRRSGSCVTRPPKPSPGGNDE